MGPFVSHPRLSSEAVEARAYQLQAVDESMSGSMLLVLPTAAGKTAVAWMAIAERLEITTGWVLMIAPTVALVNQHLVSTAPVLVGDSEVSPISISGQQPVAKRAELWSSSRLVFATPQVVRNDVLRGTLSLAECSLLCSYGALFPRTSWRFFEAGQRRDLDELFEITARFHEVSNVLFAHCQREMIDGAYDKTFLWLLNPEFPNRLLPPYLGLSEEESLECRHVLEGRFADIP